MFPLTSYIAWDVLEPGEQNVAVWIKQSPISVYVDLYNHADDDTLSNQRLNHW
jgi:hypothetical protein